MIPPRIRFIRLGCGCGAEYKVRVERIGEGAPFECVSCGAQIAVAPYASLLELVHRYSEMVLELGKRAEIDGDVVVPRPGISITEH